VVFNYLDGFLLSGTNLSGTSLLGTLLGRLKNNVKREKGNKGYNQIKY